MKIIQGLKFSHSIRFESFLTLMKNTRFIIGNSSAGIREAPYYGIPTINVGTRQMGRTKNTDIIHTEYGKDAILKGIKTALNFSIQPVSLFGDGSSNILFREIISKENYWQTPKAKEIF